VRAPAGLRRLLPLLAVLALLGAANAAVLRGVGITTDMTGFLPPPRGEASAFLLRELRSGTATTLLLVGIEGAPAPELARLSRALGEALRASDRFVFVGNGTEEIPEAERDLLFRHRYLLSPAVTPALFETPALRARLEALLDGLHGAASPLLARIGFADPVGAFVELLRAWTSGSAVALRAGVWFADPPAPGSGERALLIARTAATGLDTEAQREAVAALRAAFAAAAPAAGARLLVSGPGAFAAEAAAAIRADLAMISALSAALLAAFLLWRFRSPLMLLLAAVPLAAGVLAGATAVAAAFGEIHGAALGFGMTMLGVTADYPILLVTQRRPGEALAETARRIWPTLRLAALAAAAGLTAMVLSDVPGLAQLGLFAALGLPTSALVTRLLLPRLVPPAAGIAARALPPLLSRALLALPRWRGVAWALLAGAALYLVAIGGPPAEDDLAALSPVPAAQRALDAELRRQLGAPDVGVLIALTAPTAEAALQGAERIGEALAPLVARGALGGLDLPSRYLPSERAQRARQAALPDPATLRARLAEAAAGLPFRPGAFDRFLADVEASRTLPPLTRADLAGADGGSLLAARLDPLLARLPEGQGWQALVVPSDLRDPEALRAALTALRLPGLLVVEVKAETQALVEAATQQALLWCGVGAALVLGLLAAGLRDAAAALRTAAPLGGATLLTLTGLALLGERFALFHLVSLLLLAGVGIDYALFVARSAGEPVEERARALGSVVHCTLTTLLTFGLLAFCATPVLRAIGLTVAIGIASAAVLAATLVPAPRGAPS
jgi:predicted exporter